MIVKFMLANNEIKKQKKQEKSLPNSSFIFGGKLSLTIVLSGLNSQSPGTKCL